MKWIRGNIRLNTCSESPAVSSANPEMASQATTLRHMEMQRSVITGALCDWTISYADVVPLISFDSALHVSCGLDYVHTRAVQV